MKTILSFLLPVALLLVAAIGCSQFKDAEKIPTTVPASEDTDDLSGTYDVSGTNEGGGGAYRGVLSVSNRGSVYQFSWDTAGKKFDGVGVRTGSEVAVAFAEGSTGEGCGVVLYKIASDGSLDGKAGYWGNNSSETETAKRTKGSGLEGEYDVKGRNTDGRDYEGKLTITKSGAGFKFVWSAGASFEGFGIRQGDYVSVGVGGAKCGFVGYEIKQGGTLDGKWGGYGSRSVGTETATKR